MQWLISHLHIISGYVYRKNAFACISYIHANFNSQEGVNKIGFALF